MLFISCKVDENITNISDISKSNSVNWIIITYYYDFDFVSILKLLDNISLY